MKRIIKISVIASSLLMIIPVIFVGQEKGGSYPAAEKLQVFTDRSLYIAGETVHFSVFALTKLPDQEIPDKVIYAEIISPSTEQLIGNKFRIKQHKSSGSLAIPRDAITGIYYLRVYSKYMRNIGPAAYSYACLKIVNPSREEFRTGEDSASIFQETSQQSTIQQLFDVSINKDVFVPHEQARVIIKSINPLVSDLEGISVSVVPELSETGMRFKQVTIDRSVKKLDYYPETRGLSITGTLKEIRSRKVLPYTRVNLSIIGKGRDFMAIQTDSLGRYFFALPDYIGSRDLFLCSENTGGNAAEVLVDNDFCAIPYDLPSPVFELSDDERNLAYKLAVNYQVREAFEDSVTALITDKPINNNAFYGSPTGVIYISKYIDLPTLEEYFNELPTQVKVRRKQGKKYFKVLGNDAATLVYDPLVLVDWVAIDNPEKVLEISPKNVERIEVVNEPYIKGNIIYGGIVHIISKQGDFAGIDLPQTGIFIDYRFFNNRNDSILPEPVNTKLPDARNTLYWEPDLVLNDDNKADFSFSIPDTPGKYKITLKGVRGNGDTYTQSAVFEVK